MTLEHGHSQEEILHRLKHGNGYGHLRDMIYGAIDGTVTTFAIVAGVAGAGLSPLVVVALGLANVLADGFSMAAGNYSGIKSDLDQRKRLKSIEERHIRLDPEGEKAELREILRLKGLEGSVLEDATEAIAAKRASWINMMLVEEYGIPPVDPAPLRAAVATFVAFLACGMVPLLPFLLRMENAFAVSVAATGVVFFAIGSFKSLWSLIAWWRSGLETLIIGTTAALIAYAVGVMVGGLT